MGTEDSTHHGEPTTKGTGSEGFPHGSLAPVIVAVGLFGLAVGLIWMPVLMVGVPIFIYGIFRWVREYSFTEYERGIIPEQKRRLLGVPSGTVTIWLVILSEIFVFGALFASLFYLEAVSGPWPPEGLELSLIQALVLTTFLVSSGVALHWAHHQLKNGNRKRFNYGVAVSFILGVGFILGQVFEYIQFMDKGLTPSQGPYGSTFYALTGMHGAHVAVGLILIGLIAFRSWYRGHFTENRDQMVRTTTLYWHFVDAVWLIILVAVYFRFTG